VDKSGEYLFIKDDKAIFKFDRDLNLILDFCEGFNDRPYGNQYFPVIHWISLNSCSCDAMYSLPLKVARKIA